MLGVIAGDIIGSIYEFHNIKTKDFPLFGAGYFFTDDTVLTVDVADTILNGGEYVEKFKQYYQQYPDAVYGGRFRQWATSERMTAYNGGYHTILNNVRERVLENY